MTCEDLLEWAEAQLGDFDSYDDINQFEKDLTDAPNQASNVDKRTSNARNKLQDWFDGNLGVVDGYDPNSVKGTILSNQVDQAKSIPELDKINTGILSGGIKSGIDQKIEDKRIELGELDIQPIKDQISSALSQDDLGDIVIGPIQRQYGKDIADEIRTLLAEKGGELKSVEEEFRESLESQIGAAATPSSLDALERSARDAPTTPLEEDLLSQIERKRGQLE